VPRGGRRCYRGCCEGVAGLERLEQPIHNKKRSCKWMTSGYRGCTLVLGSFEVCQGGLIARNEAITTYITTNEGAVISITCGKH